MKDYRERLAKLLGEPIEPYEQDWEWVVSDSSRVRDYLKFYKLAYLKNHEKRLLMEMMLQAVNDDKLEFGVMPKVWLKIKALLLANFSIHKETIEYWSNVERFVPSYYSWAISKELRKVYWLKIRTAHKRRNKKRGGRFATLIL